MLVIRAIWSEPIRLASWLISSHWTSRVMRPWSCLPLVRDLGVTRRGASHELVQTWALLRMACGAGSLRHATSTG
jgi:hypothetical protein